MAALVFLSFSPHFPCGAGARVSLPPAPSVRVHASSSHAAPDPALLRRPSSAPHPPQVPVVETLLPKTEAGGADVSQGKRKKKRAKRKDAEIKELEDWEDLILQDTVPLVGFVRMVLHSGKYKNGDRLSPEHEQTIVERLLPYHPAYESKIGCGVDYITIGFHPEFENSRCLFIAQKDGEIVDFSFWKCIKGLIRQKYPLYADGFILKHFRTRRREM